MTNSLLPDHGVALDPAIATLAPVGGKRRPVKVVEHPTFRAARARLNLDGPFLVLRLPLVSLDPAPAEAAATLPRGEAPIASIAPCDCPPPAGIAAA